MRPLSLPRHTAVLVCVFAVAVAAALGTVLLWSSAADDGPAHHDAHPALRAGDCVDRSSMERRSCARAHDGKVVAVAPLRGTFRTTGALRDGAERLCEERVRRHLASTPQDGRTYRPFTVHPDLASYRAGTHRSAVCALS